MKMQANLMHALGCVLLNAWTCSESSHVSIIVCRLELKLPVNSSSY